MLFSNNASRRRQRRSVVPTSLASAIETLEKRALLSVTPLGTEALVNLSTSGTQAVGAAGGRSVAVASDNSYVTVWASNPGDGSGYSVYARRFAVDGTPLSGEILVNTSTSGDKTAPAVAVAADGRFVVAWQSQNQDGSGLAVVTRQFAADGTPLSGELIANTTTAGNQQSPAVAYLTGGGYVVTWTGQGLGDNSGVFARISNSAGTSLVGSEFRINQTTASTQSNPSVTSDGTGGFAVAWQGNGIGDSSGVFFRRFNGAGVAITGEKLVNQTTSGTQQTPSIAVRSDGSFVVAWSGNGAGDSSGVFVRRISAIGATIGNEVLVNQTTSGTQQTPSVAASGTNFTVTWQGSGATDSSGIYFRQFNSSGAALGGENRVNTSIPGTQQSPTVAALNGGLVMTWSGAGSADSSGVYMQRYTNYNFIVNSFADTVDANPGDGIAADANGKVTLRAAIMEANADHYPVPVAITLRPGVYNLTIPGAGEIGGATGDLDILSKIEIVGAGASVTTVNGNSLDRVFHVLPGASLSLRSLKVTGGNATNSGTLGGGAVLSDQASLSVSDSIISGNQALSDANNYGGGGIEVNGGTAVIRNTIFTGNTAQRITPRSPTDTSNDSSAYGAALYSEGANVNVLNSTFTNNSGHEGAAIANIDGGVMTISGTIISSNTSDFQGGGIQNELSTLSILNSTIANNQTPVDGGGLFNFAGTVNITGTSFTGNTSASTGGAIENLGRITAAIGSMSISKSNFSGNSANDGGAIANLRDSLLTIADSNVTSNSATEAGGGIFNNNDGNYGPGTVTILRTTVSNNSASLYGGGLFAQINNTDINNSTFSGNTAHEGGGADNLGGATMDVVQSNFSGNSTDHEGGGIQNELSTLAVSNSNFKNNHAGDDGGGIFNYAGTADISGSIFLGNTVGGLGGAIENTGRYTAAIGTMTISNSTISGNSANYGGGVDNKRDSVMTISDSNITDNLALTGGGGISNQETETYGPGQLTLNQVTISNNTADLYGGGLYATENTTNINNSTFSGNTAHEGGGVDNLGGAVMNVMNSVFDSNSTDHEGGGIQNELSTLSVTNSSFTNNHTAYDGGGIFNFAGTVGVDSSLFIGNAAGNQGGGIENTGRITAAIGTMTITNSIFTTNSASTGGGIDNRRDSVMTITDSTISGNSSSTAGGGVSNQNTEVFGPGTLTILRSTIANNMSVIGGGLFTLKNTTNVIDSTISNNTATTNGGGVANTSSGTTSLVNATIAYNSANQGGGIDNDSGTFNAANSIVADNTAITSNPDALGSFASGGHNLIGMIGAAIGFTNGVNGDIVGTVSVPVDPLLGTLQNNGGPTQTIALQSGSLAIDNGDNSVATAAGLTVDQRGLSRIVNGIVDIGAYEFGA